VRSTPRPQRFLQDYSATDLLRFQEEFKAIQKQVEGRRIALMAGFIVSLLWGVIWFRLLQKHEWPQITAILGIGPGVLCLLALAFYPALFENLHCPACRIVLEDMLETYCPSCGHEISQPRAGLRSLLGSKTECPGCRKELRPGEQSAFEINFCTHCGVPLKPH
jgi:hypothetical protein